MTSATRKRKAKEQIEEPRQSKAPPKRRKNTAVARTSDRATIELIRSNATTSPLLSLPTEIREKILVCLLGDKCIHLKLQQIALSAEPCPNWGEEPTTQTKQFLNNVCKTTPHQTKRDPPRALPGLELRKSSSLRHNSCETTWTPFFAGQTLDLSVLGSCRQLYEEAHTILWGTNTYVFDDRATLSTFISLLNAAQKRKLCNVYIRAIVDFSLREIQDDTKRSRKKIFTSTVDGLKHVKNLVLDVTYDIVLDAWGPTPDELELARAAVDCLRPLQAISLKQVTVHLGENFPGLGSDYNYPGQAENPEISGIAQELRSALLNENGAKLAAKARERKKPVWTEGNIRKDYQKTESLCRAVFKNARREINRYPGDRRRAIQMFLAMEKAAPRQQYRGLASSLWNVNDPVYPLKYAIVRVAKWQLTERKKRELCNKRLSKFSGAKMIEDPQYEGLEAYGENSSHEGLASVVCEETPDFDDPVEDMSSVEDEDSGIDEKAE